ncbi:MULTISPECIES: CcdB family protein [Marivita]|jgi:toxin CcdB|uniref:Toxin CcdB n=1 Tax=Marivita cryptomonadis TaxID=505252 RepID=A0A9Q2P4C1_9RHOB|nr:MULTISPECIES: CcdB family protein [Marivita]MBM2324271.1 CcdB family protein [Marivita cryptomonadis]MBM2333864.1 CcdB family protein [Marivita cryptomonadis]MBM2343438.1 CcdB family protein [Marivita cryptomonadis]MBM2348111.1 CcdB family protein [Marivita cryptomonadis]MBM2352791.1 CcdB family protein [Marivita cryptomonadis]
MAQFDLFRLTGGQLVVDLQTDLIGIDATRIVAPLREAGRYAAFPGLTPAVDHDGIAWIVRVQELAAVPRAELLDRVGSLADQRDALKRALDILIDGV